VELVDFWYFGDGFFTRRPSYENLVDLLRLPEAEMGGIRVLSGERIAAGDGLDPGAISGSHGDGCPLDRFATRRGFEVDRDPVMIGFETILENMQTLVLLVGAKFGDEQVWSAIGVEIFARDRTRIELEGGAEEERSIEESLTRAVEVEDVVFEAVP
jgi:hypothetical protein